MYCYCACILQYYYYDIHSNKKTEKVYPKQVTQFKRGR